jgi:hypothetical protein
MSIISYSMLPNWKSAIKGGFPVCMLKSEYEKNAKDYRENEEGETAL